MARPRIAFTDTVRQHDWLAAKISAPFVTPVEPPIITGRPKPPPPKPARTIIDLIDALDARPAEAAPTSPEFTPEELAEIELYVAREPIWGPQGDAAMRRWKEWVAGGRAPERSILRPSGAGAAANVDVLENRLGWAALVRYADDKDVDARSRHGHVTLPDSDGWGISALYFWRTRDAAIAYCAHLIWRSFNVDDGSTGRRLKRNLSRAENVRLFFQQCGIDVTTPPPPSLRRVIVTEARRRELKAGASPAPFPAAASAEPDMADGQPPAAVDPLRRLLARTVIPPSPLALRRRQLKEERERAGRVAAIAEKPSVYLAAIGLPQLEGLREIRGPEAAEALAALNARRPPGFVEATRVKGIRRGASYCTLTLLLSDGTEARVTARWQMGDRRYEWSGDGGTRHAWFQDTGLWFKL